MRVLGRIMTHYRLMTRMAQTTRTDLTDAMAGGDLSRQDWADMVQTCRRCGRTGCCQDWLDHRETAGCAPENCLNRTRFDTIKRRATARKGNRDGRVLRTSG